MAGSILPLKTGSYRVFPPKVTGGNKARKDTTIIAKILSEAISIVLFFIKLALKKNLDELDFYWSNSKVKSKVKLSLWARLSFGVFHQSNRATMLTLPPAGIT